MQQDLLERAIVIARRHHELLREELGEQVEAVWLTGSAVLDDLTPDSDVDTVTLTTEPLTEGAWPALTRVHTAMAEEFPSVRYDTTYLATQSLREAPVPGLVAPFSQDGVLHLGEICGEVHPVTWLLLPQSRPVAGVSPTGVEIAADRAAAEAHSRQNLRSYWAGFADDMRRQLAGRDRDETLRSAQVVVWAVLGAPRLAALIARQPVQGPIPSKSEAGAWLLEHLPQHADLAARAMAARSGKDVTFTVGDGQQVADLVTLLVHTYA